MFLCHIFFLTMNLRLSLFFVFFLLLSSVVKAQNAGDICNHLISSGRVSLIQDSRLTALLGAQPKSYYAGTTQDETGTKIKTKGYRIRVFSGNQQSSSKNRAYKIQSEIENKMPELSSYVSFKTPNWRLMVGNFRTTEEANSMLRLLRKEFPAYGKEMFVVSEEIEL